MLLAIDELKRTLKYHQRQHEENLQKIRSKEEAIELLKTANEKHLAILEQLEKALELLERADGLPTNLPIGNDSTDNYSKEEAI